VQAYMWFTIAAASSTAAAEDRDTAVHDLNILSPQMTLEQIAEAQKLASEWKPQ